MKCMKVQTVVHMWKCSSKCKPLTEFEVNAILDFKSEFEKPMRELLPILSSCDDILTMVKWCMRQMRQVRVMCHAKVTACYVPDSDCKSIDSNCKSRLRIMRLASNNHHLPNSHVCK